MKTTPANENASSVATKHVRGRDLAEVAKDVRADLKAASRAGVLRGVKTTVRVSRYSMGQSLRIEIVEVPAGVVVLSTRRIREDMGLVAERPGTMPGWRSAAGEAIIAAVEAIANAYNDSRWERSEFHLSVSFASKIHDAQRLQIEAALTACA